MLNHKKLKYIVLIMCYIMLTGFSYMTQKPMGHENITNEIIEEFKKNSSDYVIIPYEVQKNIYLYNEYLENYNKALENSKDTMYTDEYKDQQFLQAQDYLLSANTLKNYVDNQDKIVKQLQDKEVYHIVDKYLQCSVYVEQENYYEIQYQQEVAELDILTSKYKLGYATRLEVLEKKAKLEESKANIEICKLKLEQLEEEIKEQCALESFKIAEIDNSDLLLGYNDYINVYLQNYEYLNYDYTINAYNQYLTDISTKSSISTNLIEKIKNQIEITKLERSIYASNIKKYVKEEINQYKVAEQNLKSKKMELKYIQSKLTQYTNLLEEGKITPIEVARINTQEALIESEIASLYYSKLAIYYKLTYTVME